MRFVAAIFLSALTLNAAHPAMAADQWQAREVARLNNCPPTKVEVYQQSLGAQGQTLYRVDCNVAKGSDTNAKAANALLISCDESLCELLRSLPPDTK